VIVSWRIGLVFFIFLVASQASAHEEDTLDPHNATAGLRLELSELPRNSASASSRYRLHGVGFPHDVIFGVWAQDFGHLFHLVASGFQVDEVGNVVSSSKRSGRGRPNKPEQITLGPGRYPRGAVWQVALVSVDKILRAFTGVIPQPIVARDGPCTVQLELVSYSGDHFVATGSGFTSGAEVITESRYSGRVIEKRQRISANGLLLPDVLSYEAIGADHRAHYSVKGGSCKVAVEYKWGRAALLRH
jgi:hypothetical protein